MNDGVSFELFAWVVGGLTVFFGGCLACLGKAVYELILDVKGIKMAFTLINKKAAQLMHEPSNEHGADELLERYASTGAMLDRLDSLRLKYSVLHDLDSEEWEELMNISAWVTNNPDQVPLKRMLAYVLLATDLCIHKHGRHKDLMHLLEIPPNPHEPKKAQ